MKKLFNLLALLAALALAACSVDAVDATGDADGDRNAWGTGAVKLARATAYVHYKYGSTYQRSFEVRVKNLAYDKQVSIWHQKTNGTWTAIALSYARPADAGYEIWTGNTSSFYGSDLGNQFCVKAVMNGATYWDNNGGANYPLNHNDGVQLGNGIKFLQMGAWRSAGAVNGTIDVRNIAYTKSVQVVYSTDNFATQRVANASFVSSYGYGYAWVQSPNAVGIERWTFMFDTGSTAAIKYYLRYTVNGVTYYDNNFGANYSL